MASKFLSPEAQFAAGVNNRDEAVSATATVTETVSKSVSVEMSVTVPAPPVKTKSAFAAMQNQEDAPPCSTCGSIMVRSGACYKCSNCGTTSGCA
jgi:ribonucleoside-diphosphate reductase alpha chain